MYDGGVMSGRDAELGVGQYIAESPKQGSKMFNSITYKDDPLCPSSCCILFIYAVDLLWLAENAYFWKNLPQHAIEETILLVQSLSSDKRCTLWAHICIQTEKEQKVFLFYFVLIN